MMDSGGRIILGIDPGSLKTGFGLVCMELGRVKHIAHGTIVLDKKQNVTTRLVDLANDLTTIVEKYRPTMAVVEDVFLFKNPRSALVLGQARGAVLATLGVRGILIQTLSPTAVKSMITGSGRAQKFQVATMIAMALDIASPQSTDASDALALALAYALSMRTRSEQSF